MLINPNSNFIIPPLLLSTIISITSSNWIYIWMFIELNIFSFLVLLIIPTSQYNTEATINYFLIQSLTSSIIIILAITTIITTTTLNILFLTAIITNAGSAPAHQWILSVSNSLPSYTFVILITWQNIIPLILILTYIHNPNILSALAIINASIGAISGLFQTLLRPLLTYSSINHNGWIIIAITISLPIFLTYIFVYFIILIIVIYTFSPSMPQNHWQEPSTVNIHSSTSGSNSINLISLAGIPPLLGFSINWIVLTTATPHIIVISLIIIISIITLLYYTLLTLNSVTHNNNTNLSQTNTPLNLLLYQIITSPLIILLT